MFRIKLLLRYKGDTLAHTSYDTLMLHCVIVSRMTEGSARYKTHKNKENRVKCPYCDAETASRGLYQHVWRSSDEAHGGHKNVPDTWEQDKEDLEIVGERDVTLNVPTSKKYDHQRMLCKYCGEDFKGTHGLSVHLSRVSDNIHPEDADIETAGLRVPVGPDDAVVVEDEMLEDIEGHNIDPDDFSDASILKSRNVREGGADDDPDDEEVPEGYVPVPDLVELVGYYERDGKMEAAEELRSLLQKYT